MAYLTKPNQPPNLTLREYLNGCRRCRRFTYDVGETTVGETTFSQHFNPSVAKTAK